MTRSRPITFLVTAAAIPLTGLAVSACGGSGVATASPSPPRSVASGTQVSNPHTSRAHPATVRLTKTRLGRILVDMSGRTLYLFKGDVGGKSACTGACAAAWPPLLTQGKPNAGRGVTASKLGTITRPGDSRQVTYNGHPLYLFIKDQKAGDTNGEGLTAFGAAWFVVSPAGNQVLRQSSRHGAVSSSGPPAAATPPAVTPQPAPKSSAPPVPKPAPTPKPAPPAAHPAPPANSGIPQNNGGDGDSDNNGGPSDGDGNI